MADALALGVAVLGWAVLVPCVIWAGIMVVMLATDLFGLDELSQKWRDRHG